MDRNGYNPSILHDGDCLFCHNNEVVRHEIFQGKNRTNSKVYGLWITVCPTCHRAIHNTAEMSTALKIEAEQAALKHYGWSTKDFIKVFNKNYI